MSLIDVITHKIREITNHSKLPIAHTIKPLKGLSSNQLYLHHFLTFLKPEILSIQDGVDVSSLLKFIFDHYQKWDIHIEAIGILSGTYLKKHSIISRNYETLHKISHLGLEACTESVQYELNQQFRELITPTTLIMGGHQFLKLHSRINSKELNNLINDLTVKKLGSGAYATHLHFNNQNYILINAFHPFQIESLTAPGQSIIALECFSQHSWPVLRHEFVGAINPETSKKGSLRRKIFDLKEIFNLKEVDVSHNALHISPGPIEAVFQLLTFFDPEKRNYNNFRGCRR